MVPELMALCLAGVRPALPQDWWTAWSLAPATLVPLAVLLAWLCMHRAAPTAFAGWLLLAASLVSPLCRLAATLAWAHMAQLMLLLAGTALLVAMQARPAARHSAGLAALVHGLLLWAWHMPPVYALVLQRPAPHLLAYASLAASSWWFWRTVLQARAEHRGAALLALLATTAHTGLLGALLSFAATPLYPLHAPGARAWGLDPLQDQQLAGLLMWVVGALGYLLAAVALALRWSGAGRATTAGQGREPARP